MKNEIFEKFGPVLEAEMLTEEQMDAVEGGKACESGCKKSCKPGNQNTVTEYRVPGPAAPDDINELN